MKRIIFCFLTLFVCAGVFAQQLTVAVSPFEVRGGMTEDEAESITELFISQLVTNRTLRVVDRNSFDQIMNEMRFQRSDWADTRRVAELGRMLNADSIIRGTVMSLAGEIVITASVLDITTAQILSSSNLRMRNLREIFDHLPEFVNNMTRSLPNSQGTNTQRPSSNAIAIEVSTRTGGTLFFQNEEIATLWANDNHTIPIERPGTYTVKLQLANGVRMVRTLTIAARGIVNVEFGNNARIGDEGPGGGVIFFAERGSYKEVSRDLGIVDMVANPGRPQQVNAATNLARNHRGGGFTDWRLPDRMELNLIHENLFRNNLGGNFGALYVSSESQQASFGMTWWVKVFNQPNESDRFMHGSFSVRAVREFRL
jgi:TolB-like protein